ncbi:RNA polymerase sigma factor [Parapedobacter deserti]|uniref:RNA polymerase sigma factor n=1 Tax=Parapedobacter deserti TaxID=1912957 RepID=A0ABV7JR93_9SPHI
MNNPGSHTEILPHLFRQEHAKMTAVLCRHFGLKHVEIAEDIASDTFLKASEHWAIHGTPGNPIAWLYTVAKNKAKDYFKKLSVFETKVKNNPEKKNIHYEFEFEYNDQLIADSQLAMIFAVCNPANSSKSQICLALQILCGFSVEEIANAFLTKAETIKKRLQRARTNLRNDKFQIRSLSEAAIVSRLSTVLKTLYLVFNEGYFSKTSDQHVRKELCSEAIRLGMVLTDNALTDTPQVNALLALMCYQSSRLEARAGDNGEIVLFDEQDREKWDKSLIQRGNWYLINATSGDEISAYHLEAGIAYWHTVTSDAKWQHILQLYNQLIVIDYTPIVALNRVFAFAKVYGRKKAVVEAEKLELTGNGHYHGLLGYLYSESDTKKAIAHYEQAIQLTRSKKERQVLAELISRCAAGYAQ